MRALKTLLIIVLAVGALLLIVGLSGPKHAHVERTTMIAAPSSIVWDHVKSLKKQNDWSPFLAMDPGMKATYEGTDGAVGSKCSWSGGKTGKGEQTIAAVDPGKSIQTELHFIEPFEGVAKAVIAVEPRSDSTQVTWSYDGKNSFIARIISVFKNMDAMMGSTFAVGLAQLKGLCEADAAKQAEALKARTFRGYVVETVQRPSMTYLGKRETVKWDRMSDFFTAAFPLTGKAIEAAGLNMGGPPSALFYEWDTLRKQADVFAGMPVLMDTAATVAGLQMVTIPAGKALMIAYQGDYDGTMEAHLAMEDMLQANGMEVRDAVIEEYVTDPTQEPDTAKWLTNIIYPIK